MPLDRGTSQVVSASAKGDSSLTGRRIPVALRGAAVAPPRGTAGNKWLGKYVLVRRIAKGGSGDVFEAFDTALERGVAIKVLAGEKARQPGMVKRFVAEARSFARVNHPNAVTILDVDCRDGVCFLVMELMAGGSVQDVLDRGGPLGWLAATRVLMDACRALVATHAAGLSHRDVKPSNLMIGAGGVVKLADYGLAADAEAVELGDGPSETVAGTPAFMSPEQCRGERVDLRSDLYSSGATYYALLTGAPPYRAKLRTQVMFAHCSAPVPDPRDVNPAVPAACAAVIRRAMSKLPADRYSSALEMLEDLEGCAAIAAAAGWESVVEPDEARCRVKRRTGVGRPSARARVWTRSSSTMDAFCP